MRGWICAMAAGIFAAACGAGPSNDAFALRGTILTPDTVIHDGLVVIHGGRIERVEADAENVAAFPTISTDGIILPGLVDLHNHIFWSVFPRWKAEGAFASRDVWAASAAYRQEYSGPERTLRQGHACDMSRFGEVRAIIGGVTSMLTPVHRGCPAGLIRSVGHDEPSAAQPTHSSANTLIDVDLLTPSFARRVARQLRDGSSDARLFVHVGEGRAGESAPRREFAQLMKYGLLTDRTVLLHGTGLGDAEFDKIAAAGASLVWSPRSNIELYGETTNIAWALERGIPVALGADWSVTGSVNLLEELRYAAAWSRHNLGSTLDDRQLVQMVTSVPADIASIAGEVGSIRPGLHADLLVVRGVRSDPYRSVVTARPGDVRLVLVGGAPRYGTVDLMKSHNRWDRENVNICGTVMALDTTAGPASLLDLRYRLSATSGRLRRALSTVRLGLELPALAECDAGAPD